MNMAYVELSTIFDEAGVSAEVRKFIYDMGITKTAVFARVATSTAELKERIVTPFFTDQTPTLAVQVVVEATVSAAWDAANIMRTEITSAAWTPPTSSSVAMPASSSPSSSVTPAIPTTLRPGQWEEQVKKYENHWVPPRKFPVKVLIGAESVLARILHEATSSRLFSPISIGEILKVRAWASSGLINNMALKKHDEKILGWRRVGDSAELVPTSNRFDPKSSWAIIDGLESIRWAYTWAGYGGDATTEEFVTPFIQLVQQRPT